MSSNQLDPRSMKDVEQVSNYAPGMQPQYLVPESGWVVWIQFAGLMLMLVGAFHAVEGLVAIFRDEVFVVTKQHLILNVDYTTWGWIHLIFGAIMVLAGIGLLAGRMVARIVGVVVAFISALLNVSFLPASPVWSVMMITIDVLIIWAIMVHGGELKRSKS